MDGMLSQEEINALLAGASGSGDSSTTDSSADNNAQNAAGQEDNNNTPSAQNEQQFVLSDSEKDAVGEISNISMGTAATTLSSLLNQKVNITTPTVEVSTWDELSVKYDRPCVMLQISYKEGIDGNNVLILKERDVKIITDLMMGGTGQVDDDEPLSELHLSAIGEAMNQMMGSAATSMSSMFNRKIDISPPIANMVETYSDSTDDLPPFLKGQFVMVAFKMQIGDLIDSEIMQLYPIEFAKELLNLFTPELNAVHQLMLNHSLHSQNRYHSQHRPHSQHQHLLHHSLICQHRHHRECLMVIRRWECLMVIHLCRDSLWPMVIHLCRDSLQCHNRMSMLLRQHSSRLPVMLMLFHKKKISI